MKLGKLLVTGLLASAAYRLYQNREQMSMRFHTSKEALKQGKASLSTAQSQIESLKHQVPDLKKTQDNLNYKIRVFQEEVHPHLEAIQDILNKYKQDKYIF